MKKDSGKKIDQLLEKIRIPKKFMHLGAVYFIKKARQPFIAKTFSN